MTLISPRSTRLAALALVGASVFAVGAPNAFGQVNEGGTAHTFCFSGCEPRGVQDIAHVYARGQAFEIPCAPNNETTFPCNGTVEGKVTVLASVAKTLGLSSTTIAQGKATGPVKTTEGGEPGTFYFLPLRASAEKKMKAKKVRVIAVTVSGSTKGPTGTVKNLKTSRADWSYRGNCMGPRLHIERRLTYGGTCMPF